MAWSGVSLLKRNFGRRNLHFGIYSTLGFSPQSYGAETGVGDKRQWRRKVKHHIKRFLANKSGATAIEYGLIAAGIALAIIAIVNGLGSNLNSKFTSINNSLGGGGGT